MAVKDDSVYLGHMLDTAQDVQALMEGVTRQQFDQDQKLRWALVHLIQTIGEAARRVSAATRASAAGIPWKQIIGMRHHVVHDYLFVDYDVVWNTATHDIQPLINSLQQLLPPAGPTP